MVTDAASTKARVNGILHTYKDETGTPIVLLFPHIQAARGKSAGLPPPPTNRHEVGQARSNEEKTTTGVKKANQIFLPTKLGGLFHR
jgi:hypothetical protein